MLHRSWFWLLAAAAICSPGLAGAKENLPEGAAVVRLDVQPASIQLGNRYDYAQLLVFGELTNGQRLDVTRMVDVQAAPAELVTVSERGLVRPAHDGAGELRLRLAGLEIGVPVTVAGTQAAYTVSFVQDVMPAMSKLGCNAGTCHGAKDGKNGFKMSLRGYDPVYDHRALTDDLAGRRFNRAVPEQSLMLLKPAGGVPHVGGVKMHEGEPHYEILRAWIAQGVKLDQGAPRVARIELAPQNPMIALPGMSQQMRVLATYSDGRVRDVTAEAFVASSLTEKLDVDATGLATAVRRGEAAVLARYEGAYASTIVTVMGDREQFVWQETPEYTWVDTLVYDKLKRIKVQPSEVCSDEDFARRVYLDVTGIPPAPEVLQEFLSDARPSREKRDALVDRLVGSADYVEHWTNKWSDLLMVNRKFLSVKGAWALRNWIREAIAANVPYDQFAYQVLTASGSTFENPPSAYLRTLREADAAMENSTQLFLGVRFNCNKCHDHPFERWTQKQYYDLAAYFVQVGRKPGNVQDEEVIFDVHSGEMTNPLSGQVVPPSFPYAHDDVLPATASRREQFAHWVISPQNQYFATSFVNRIWSYLLGVGLIEPVDDIRAGNPPSNPELLHRLTGEFVAHGFDVQHLIRLICKSRVYQHAVATNAWNDDDEINYSHALARRLSAETLYDAIQVATGTQRKLPGVPNGFRAAQLPDSAVELPGGFLDVFGKPPRESACECERASGVVLGQALTLVNGPIIADAIADPNNRITTIVQSQNDNAAVVDALFVSILCRHARPDEVATGVQAIGEAPSRLEGAQDLAWALINSPAFLFNH
ncbi:MAG: DUF1553 domain-containing protein [Pirellulales bacterium]|nr:DUF1553 domain-containing protein [Pirellulales bacterium]